MQARIKRNVRSVINVSGTTRSNLHPNTAAALYFTMSPMNPTPRVCRPRVHTPPSTSMAIYILGWHNRSAIFVSHRIDTPFQS